MFFCSPPRSSALPSKIYNDERQKEKVKSKKGKSVSVSVKASVVSVISVFILRSFSVGGICVFLCISGCVSNPAPKPAALSIDTPGGMIAYLNSQNLPALKSVEPWASPFGQGLKLTTTHYEIHTTLLEPLMLSQVPGFMESAYRSYQAQLPKPIETSTLFTVYLFADRHQWETFTVSFTGPQAPLYLQIKKGAYYLNGSCVAYYIGRESTFTSIGHEGWHQFNSRYFKYRLPSWLDEGIAMTFETSAYEGGFFVFQPERNMNRLGGLKKTLLSNETIPLRELVSINPGEVVAEINDITAFYSQAYALVRFLREDNYGKRLASYQKLLLDGLTGQWPLSEADRRIAADRNILITVGWNRMAGSMLFEHYFTNSDAAKVGDDFGKIEKQYIAFCRKIVYNIQLRN